MIIGKVIKLLREKAMLSQQELADKSNVSKSYISQIENDKKAPALDKLEMIAKALDVPMSSIFFKASELTEIQIADLDSKFPNDTEAPNTNSALLRIIQNIAEMISSLEQELIMKKRAKHPESTLNLINGRVRYMRSQIEVSINDDSGKKRRKKLFKKGKKRNYIEN